MKKLKLLGLLLAVLFVGVIAGGWLGAWWSARILTEIQVAKPEVELAFRASQEANWAAALRMGEVTNVIANLENGMRIQLGAIAAWETIAPADVERRKDRNRFLKSVKVYCETYPIDGSDATLINELLTTVPDRDLNSTCDSFICRLDDLRRAKLESATNSP